MADTEDWLALQVAASQSPFRTFQRLDAPFEAADPGADTVYSTQDVNRIAAHQGRSNPLRAAFGWLKGLLPHGEEAAPRQSLPEAMASPQPVSLGARLADAPARALNLASAMAELPLHSGERYAEGFGQAAHGRTAGHGFAGTGVDEQALLIPPQALAAFVPGLRGLIARGEANPISTYDRVRAKLEDVPLLNWERGSGIAGERPGIPLPGAPAVPGIWPGEEFLPQGRPAWKHQGNPFSTEAATIRDVLQKLKGAEEFPRPPPFVDSTPLGPNGSHMNATMERPGNERSIGEVKLAAESGKKSLFPASSDRSPRDAALKGARDTFYEPQSPAGALLEYLNGGLGNPRHNQEGLKRYVAGLRDFEAAEHPTSAHYRNPGDAQLFVDPTKLNAEAGERLAPFTAPARRTEPLPLTQGVADWLREAGKEPRVQVARGPNATDYVSLPIDPRAPGGFKKTFVRVPEDSHVGMPKAGQIDTAPPDPRFPDEFSRRNAAGEPFSKPDALIDALKWATSSAPGGGNWLVAPGKEPRWARYPKEEPAAPARRPDAESYQGPLQPTPLAQSGGELWARGGESRIAPFAGSRRGEGVPDRVGGSSQVMDYIKSQVGRGKPMPTAADIAREFGWTSQGARDVLERLSINGSLRRVPAAPNPHKRKYDYELLVQSGDLRTMLAAARSDPAKKAAIEKTLANLKGVSPQGIANVLEQQHGIPRTGERWWEAKDWGDSGRPVKRWYGNGAPGDPVQTRIGETLNRVVEMFKQQPPPPPKLHANNKWAQPENAQRFWDAYDKHAGHHGKTAEELGLADKSRISQLVRAVPRVTPQSPEAAAAEAARKRGSGLLKNPLTDEDIQRKRDYSREFMRAKRAGEKVKPAAELDLGNTERPLYAREGWEQRARPPRVKAMREKRVQGEASAPELEKRQDKPFWDETGKAQARESDLDAVRRLFAKRKPE